MKVRKKDLGSRHSDEEDDAQERRGRMMARQRHAHALAPTAFIVVDDINDTPDVQWIPSFDISEDERNDGEGVIEILPPPEAPAAQPPEPQWSSEIIDLTNWADSPAVEREGRAAETRRQTIVDCADDSDDILEVSTAPSQPRPLFVQNFDMLEGQAFVLPLPRPHLRRRTHHHRRRQPVPAYPTPATTTTNTTTTTTTPVVLSLDEDDSWLNETIF